MNKKQIDSDKTPQYEGEIDLNEFYAMYLVTLHMADGRKLQRQATVNHLEKYVAIDQVSARLYHDEENDVFYPDHSVVKFEAFLIGKKAR